MCLRLHTTAAEKSDSVDISYTNTVERYSPLIHTNYIRPNKKKKKEVKLHTKKIILKKE